MTRALELVQQGGCQHLVSHEVREHNTCPEVMNASTVSARRSAIPMMPPDKVPRLCAVLRSRRLEFLVPRRPLREQTLAVEGKLHGLSDSQLIQVHSVTRFPNILFIMTSAEKLTQKRLICEIY